MHWFNPLILPRDNAVGGGSSVVCHQGSDYNYNTKPPTTAATTPPTTARQQYGPNLSRSLRDKTVSLTMANRVARTGAPVRIDPHATTSPCCARAPPDLPSLAPNTSMAALPFTCKKTTVANKKRTAAAVAGVHCNTREEMQRDSKQEINKSKRETGERTREP